MFTDPSYIYQSLGECELHLEKQPKPYQWTAYLFGGNTKSYFQEHYDKPESPIVWHEQSEFYNGSGLAYWFTLKKCWGLSSTAGSSESMQLILNAWEDLSMLYGMRYHWQGDERYPPDFRSFMWLLASDWMKHPDKYDNEISCCLNGENSPSLSTPESMGDTIQAIAKASETLPDGDMLFKIDIMPAAIRFLTNLIESGEEWIRLYHKHYLADIWLKGAREKKRFPEDILSSQEYYDDCIFWLIAATETLLQHNLLEEEDRRIANTLIASGDIKTYGPRMYAAVKELERRYGGNSKNTLYGSATNIPIFFEGRHEQDEYAKYLLIKKAREDGKTRKAICSLLKLKTVDDLKKLVDRVEQRIRRARSNNFDN